MNFCTDFTRPRTAVLLLGLLIASSACERSDNHSVKASIANPSTAAIPESNSTPIGNSLSPRIRKGVKPGDFLTGKRDYPTGDTADVYRAVLDTLYVTSSGSPALVVLYDVADAKVMTCYKQACPVLPDHLTDISESTLDAFRQVTLYRRHIRHDFSYHLPLRFFSDRYQKLIELDGRFHLHASREQTNIDHPFWLGFVSQYPTAWGYAAMTQVGMNPEKNEALVQVRHQCGGSCWSIETMVARKRSGRWGIVERIPEMADSLDRRQRYLRFRGVGARKPNAEVREEVQADSAKLDRLSRGIHGTIVALDWKPIAGAVVTVHLGEDPNTPWTRVTADSSGFYRIVNPPAGGAGLMVRCPRSSLRPDTLMAVGGTDVKVGRDVVFDIRVDRRICDDPAHVGAAQMIHPMAEKPAVR